MFLSFVLLILLSVCSYIHSSFICAFLCVLIQSFIHAFFRLQQYIASFTQPFRKIHGKCVPWFVPGWSDFGSFTLPVIFRNLCVCSHTTRKDPVKTREISCDVYNAPLTISLNWRMISASAQIVRSSLIAASFQFTHFSSCERWSAFKTTGKTVERYSASSLRHTLYGIDPAFVHTALVPGLNPAMLLGPKPGINPGINPGTCLRSHRRHSGNFLAIFRDQRAVWMGLMKCLTRWIFFCNYVFLSLFFSVAESLWLLKWYHGVYKCHLQCCVGLSLTVTEYMRDMFTSWSLCADVWDSCEDNLDQIPSLCLSVRRMWVSKGHWCDFLRQCVCVCVLRGVPVCVCARVAGGHGLCSLWHWYTALKPRAVLLGWAAVGLRHRHTWEITFYEQRKWRWVQDSITGAEMMHVNRTSLLTRSGPYSDLGTPQSTHTHTHTH